MDKFFDDIEALDHWELSRFAAYLLGWLSTYHSEYRTLTLEEILKDALDTFHKAVTPPVEP